MEEPDASVEEFTVTGSCLGQGRRVSVFFPPGYNSATTHPVLYCTDGEAVGEFAGGLAAAIRRGTTPPVVLVGAHSDRDYRNREYLAGLDERRFAAHLSFFTEELYRWSHDLFALDSSRELCGVFGFSCGAAFALSVGTRHPLRYGSVIAFSVAGGAERVVASQYAIQPVPRVYVSAGKKELSFRETCQAVVRVLAAHGIDHKYTERNAGHDLASWVAELPTAIRWCYRANGEENGTTE